MSEVPTDVGPYTPERRIGRGAQAEVWLAKGPDGRVALKVARSDEHHGALRKEVEVRQRCDHPALVRLIDHDPDHRWLALEHVEGFPLDLWSDDEPLDAIVEVVAQVIDVLQHLHSHDVVHGDIKPSNILVDDNGKAHLLDFGIATLADESRSGFRGTLGYAAPELLRGEAPSPASDIYGVGGLLYRCLTGHAPFTANDPAALTYLPMITLPVPPSAVRPTLPKLLNNVVLTTLCRNPQRRPRDLSKLATTLRRSTSGPPGKLVLAMPDEREAVRKAVVAAGDGEPRVVVMYGPPGSGRRTLIQEGVDAARREGLPYIKGSNPEQLMAAIRKATRAPVLVARPSEAMQAFAKQVLSGHVPVLLFLHSEHTLPELAALGAVQLTPSPLDQKSAVRLARMMGADPGEAEAWWRASLGLPIAFKGQVYRWLRSQPEIDSAGPLGHVPNDSKRIFLTLQQNGRLDIDRLAKALGLDAHTLLDHCEVLFAEGLIRPAKDGSTLEVTPAA